MGRHGAPSVNEVCQCAASSGGSLHNFGPLMMKLAAILVLELPRERKMPRLRRGSRREKMPDHVSRIDLVLMPYLA